VGEIVDLSQLNAEEKKRIIKDKAIPFQTFLYRQGHIVLYVGTYNDEIIVFQNMWGIRTKDGEKEGRVIIGRTVFSTLQFGKELKNYDKSAELLGSITSMNTITR
jgi:hypothetical protein